MHKKRCIEEFNPWPAFVDIFSSVILVLLLFLLITIVNVAYYGQFKYKVSYTQSLPAEELIKKSDPDFKKEFIYTNEAQKEQPKQTQQEPLELIKETTKKVEDKSEVDGEIARAGKDLSKFYEDEETKQSLILNDTYIILNFGNSGIKLDNPIMLQIKEFITSAKKKYPNHIVKINAIDPTNQISMTATKQISLARVINTRNLIRELGYNIRDVRVDLKNPKNIELDNKNEYGYILVRIESK